MEESLGAASEAVAATKTTIGGSTKDLGGGTISAEELQTTIREGMSLIDRFYDGGNKAKPEALNILVGVLDQVISRMRQQYANRARLRDDCMEQIRIIDASLNRIRPKQAQLQEELAVKTAQADALRAAVEMGTTTVKDNLELARSTLRNAKIVTRNSEIHAASRERLELLGYDGSGKPIPGREKNMRKNPNGPAARKAGDMLRDLPEARATTPMLPKP